jgi:hypothetical protein
MNRTDEILNKDSLAETEKIFGGKDYHDFNEFEQAVSLINFMQDNKIKEEHLKSIGDTYFGMKWNDFKELLKRYGFQEGLSYNFINDSFGNKHNEEAILYYHKEKGLILWATTYGEDSINGGTVYGQVKINKEDDYKDLYKVLNCTHDSFGWYDRESRTEGLKDAVYFNMDVREGLIYKLENINKVAEFASQWTVENHSKKPRMYLYDFIEDDQEGFSFKDSTMDKINRACQDVRDIIGDYSM